MSSKQEDETDDSGAVTGQKGRDPAVLSAVASVGLALYYFYVRGDRERGIFIGLWAPTILGLASYLRQTRMNEEIRQALGKEVNLRESVQKVLGTQ